MNFQHLNFLKRRLTLGQPAGWPEQNDFFVRIGGETHQLFCLDKPVPGSTRTLTRAKKFMFYVPFSFPELPQASTNIWPVFRASFFPFCPLCWPPLFLPFFSAPFRPFSPPRKVLCSVEKRVQSRASRGAAPGCTSPQSSGRKFLPEICVKKGQTLNSQKNYHQKNFLASEGDEAIPSQNFGFYMPPQPRPL